MGANQLADARLLAEVSVAVPMAEGAKAGRIDEAIATAVRKAGETVRERVVELVRE